MVFLDVFFWDGYLSTRKRDSNEIFDTLLLRTFWEGLFLGYDCIFWDMWE
jgi:hypothetical protein